MNYETEITKLRKAFENNEVVIITGTGVSISSCRKAGQPVPPAASWQGLIQHGVEHCCKLSLAHEDDATLLLPLIKSGRTQHLIHAGEEVTRLLNGHSNGTYRAWLEDTLGGLKVQNRAVIEALHRLPGVLATLNYDGLIEEVSGRSAATWLHPDATEDYLRTDTHTKVFHLHGYFKEPDSMVFGAESYERVKKHEHARAILQSFTTRNTILFVGCGDTIQDPNFTLLCEWALSVLNDVKPRHWYLCRESELAKIQGNIKGAPWLQALPYGTKHEDLAPFLQRLAPTIKPATASKPAPTKKALPSQINDYLKWVIEDTGVIELRGVEAEGKSILQLPLQDAFVPLAIRPTSDKLSPLRGRTSPEDQEPERPVSLHELLGLGNRLVITGGAGSGKTTVLLHTAWALATSLLNKSAEPAASRLGLTDVATLPLPIRVPFASYVRYRRDLPRRSPPEHYTLQHYISHHLIRNQAGFGLSPDFFAQLINEEARVILLLDGLDEVANEAERDEVRQEVENLVKGRDRLQVVVTCRTLAYRDNAATLGVGFREIVVLPLDSKQHIEPMIYGAYRCVFRADDTARKERAGGLLRDIDRLEADRRARMGDQYQPLVNSPLMVRLLLIVELSARKLPDERAELFRRAIEALLLAFYARDKDVRDEYKQDWTLRRDMVQHVAYHLHREGTAQTGRNKQKNKEQGRDINESDLKALLETVPRFAPNAASFTADARQRGGVMEERGGNFRFAHHTFQEFLAARYLAEVVRGPQKIVGQLEPNLTNPWWREPVLLLAGYLDINSPEAAKEFLTLLASAGAARDDHIAAVELAATAALESPRAEKSLKDSCVLHIQSLFGKPATSSSKATGVLLARAGDALGRLGDPRAHLTDVDHMRFSYVPPGPFWMGEEGEADAKLYLNQSLHYGYWIAQCPVTVAQMKQFATDSGHKLADDALTAIDNRPVVDVSWRDARAFCDWLIKRWQGKLPGWRVTLPSEAEWEKAARGGTQIPVKVVTSSVGEGFVPANKPLRDNKHAQRRYPWGDKWSQEHCNAEMGVGAPSTPGCFISGRSPYDCEDMAGNVWEWTRSAYTKQYPPDDGKNVDVKSKDMRVVRGGSWNFFRVNARCAYRGNLHPDLRRSYLGFRVLLRPPL